ncbi:hypothetical protein TKK_0017213 [Trichogramma kaykai]|uniref:BPL/LPL catalytic domain-containing protein n=1 Tax=Trichogramma kaykai TaxID=54128 RepID=A0ABD2W4Y4_9HYME
MLLTVFYMLATWIQSWRLSSLRGRLQAILLESEAARPSVMLYTASQLSIKDESNNGACCSKSLNGNGNGNGKGKLDLLSSHLCSNSNIAKLGDLLWYQGDKRLCTIYPQQKIDVSSWLLYPYGRTIFPLFTHNNSQTSLLQDTKLHVLIEADLKKFIPLAFTKATKLEDYGTIVAWTSDDIFAVILETDLEHITKFSTTLMQGQCFINNGLPVTRIESVSVSGKPCVCNYERFNFSESRKLTGSSQWNSYIKKLRLVSSAARIVSEHNESVELKEIPGLIVSPGCKPISLQLPTILKITDPKDKAAVNDSSVPCTPPPTPASATNTGNGNSSNQALKSSIDLHPSLTDLSIGSMSNLSTSRSQDFILEESSLENLNETTPLRNIKSLKKYQSRDTRVSSMASSRSSLASTVNFSPSRKIDGITKPPNILIFADSANANDNVRGVLETILKENKYVIYALTVNEAKDDKWMDQANLVIVCGNVGADVGAQLVEYIVRGGKLLALCSDILKTLLPAFKTAEVRENELVRFSYGKWQHVRMMHHVFCYQASPVKTKFSHDQEDSGRSVTPPTPISTTIVDRQGKSHTFGVRVLGSEETWHTPSILLADQPESGGKAVFSQIHLEADPSQYELEESKFNALKQSNSARLEIFADLLANHLGMHVNPKPRVPPVYTPGFFLGKHELKLEMLKNLKSKMGEKDVIRNSKMEIQFCGTTSNAKPASSMFLPVMVHRCPENFSTVEYFENLSTREIGRLVIYTDILTSTYDVVQDLELHHGLAVVSRLQTRGQGRGRNLWLSPEGCAMFNLQLHIPRDSVLGDRIPLIQHLVATAIVHAVKSMPDYENLDLRLKWPNDIYTSTGSKIGGLVVKSLLKSNTYICDIGTGINLSNSSPTVCINDLVKIYNEKNSKKLKKITTEKLIAHVFNHIESLIDEVQKDNFKVFLQLYYKYWLHTEAEITVMLPDETAHDVKISGIDLYGFLQVEDKQGKVFTVQPDGNSFDIMSGLIAPKI